MDAWLCVFLVGLVCSRGLEAKQAQDADGLADGEDAGTAGKLRADGDQRHDWLDGVSIEAQQTLLDTQRELSLGSMTERPLPIYRKDLPSDYIAYWLVVYDANSYVIVSAGPQTGDRKLVEQAALPGVVQTLRADAKRHASECTRLFRLTPDGVMMCEDAAGMTSATTIRQEVFQSEFGRESVDPETLHRFIQSKLEDLRIQWTKHADEVYRSGEWFDEEIDPSAGGDSEGEEGEAGSDEETADPESFESEIEMGEYGTKTNENFRELQLVSGGEGFKLAVGDPSLLLALSIKYLLEGRVVDTVTDMQTKLCAVVNICDELDTTRIRRDAIERDPDTGIQFIHIKVKDNAKEILAGRDVGFSVEIQSEGGDRLVRHFAISYEARRQRRFKEYGSTSAWTEKSIPDEQYFPDYNQHSAGKCSVGCGPVAWAQIFGYFDRRAHMSTSKYGSGSQALWRCGTSATDGANTCIAPMYTTSTVNRYTEALNSAMGTFCAFGQGATLMNQMTKISPFFSARQASGSPSIIKKSTFWTWLGITQSSIAAWTRSRIDEGWPVVVGAHEGFLKWHYPVVTKYRSRTVRYRSCVRAIWKICGRWKTSTEYEMFTHQGWGGTGNRWRDMKVFFATAARY